MVNEGLVKYLYQYLAQGHELNSLRTYLYQHGYQIDDIDEAIRYIQSYYPQVIQPAQQSVVHHHNISAKTLFALFLLFILVPGAGFMIYKLIPDGSPEQLLDISTTSLTAEVKPGEEVLFELSLEAYGSAKRFDATVIAQIVGSTGEVLAETQFVQAVETRSSKTVQLTVPKDTKQGRYKVKTLVSYKDVTEEASFIFQVGQATVIQNPTCSDGITNQGEEGIDCGGPCETECSNFPTCFDGIRNQGELMKDCGGPCQPCSVSCENCVPLTPCTDANCIGGTCKYTPRIPCCGNMLCETGEIFEECPADCDRPTPTEATPEEVREEAKELSETDPEGAARLCAGLDSGRIKDLCFTDVAKISQISKICLNIEEAPSRDACYMDAAMGGDFSVCDKIIDTHLKTTCDQLKHLGGLNLS
jgi:hypothetical protein